MSHGISDTRMGAVPSQNGMPVKQGPYYALSGWKCTKTPLQIGAALGSRLALYLHELKTTCPNMQLPPNYYWLHSLIRGGVTAAWHAEIDKDLLKLHGR